MNPDAPSPLQSLQIIDSMISKARNRFSENGHLYLLWGWVIFVCAVGHYLLEQVIKTDKFYMVWFLTWPTVIYQIIYIRMKRRRQPVATYADDILKYVWLAFIVMMLLLAVVVGRFANEQHDTDAVFMVLYGMPTFLSGVVLRFTPLKIGAICCWLFAIVSLFIPLPYHMLLLAASVVAGWIIPGYLLRKKFKQQQN